MYLKEASSTSPWSLLRCRYHEVIMKVEDKDKSTKHFWDREMNFREVAMKSASLVVFIRHDSAEIWEFRYGLALGLGTKKNTASTVVFVFVVCALKHAISGGGR